ncbi:MAG: EAL domain-containing response regulator [Betaproteobacteria bacterium]
MDGGLTNTSFADMSVLIVDDDNYQRSVLERMLGTIGIVDISQAASASEALQQAARLGERLQVVISDLDMPGVDGMEFLRLLAEQQPGAAVLIVSGKHASILRSVELMAKEYGLAMLGTLGKPPRVSTLRTRLAAFAKAPANRPRSGAAAMSAAKILEGLDLDQFEPFFQPKAELESRRICGAEALVRWRHPTLGIVVAGSFIDVAEENGLIDRLTWAILEKTAAQMRRWEAAGVRLPVNVNFSQSSLSDTLFPSRLIDVLARHGVQPERLIVEITESVAMTDIAHCLESLSRLRMRGFGLSIDDFGTGHSSMQQLTRAPYTELKIDQAFVTGASAHPHLRAVLESGIDIARKLNMQCVGEGVETLDDWNCLKLLRCDIAQGYFIGRPMEGDLFPAWAKEWAERDS